VIRAVRPRKAAVVAAFAFTSTVRRPGYLIATFGMPVFVVLYGIVAAIPGLLAARMQAQPRTYGVVDRAGALGLAGETTRPRAVVPPELRSLAGEGPERAILEGVLEAAGRFTFRRFESEEEAGRALRGKAIAGYYVLAEDFLATGRVDAYLPEGPALESKDTRGPLEDLLVDGLVRGKLPDEVAVRVREPIAEWREWAVGPEGEVHRRDVWAVVARIGIPLAFAILMLISLMMSAGYLLQALAVEKENKVVEVLLSSVGPQEILAGKLLGLGGAGLLQIGVWFSMAGALGLSVGARLSAAGLRIPWAAVGFGLVFFVAGYLFIGSLMLATGSLGSDFREAQQMSMVWSLLSVLPMMFLPILLEEPNAVAGRGLTWIPFTSPLTIVFRLAASARGVAWWEVAGSLAVLVLATAASLRFGARLFRVGLLLTGARPKLREILRQARLAG
jgi:ABC-2 type transport system permease protein